MVASRWWRGAILAFGILFLAACGENVDLFSSLDDPAEPELFTVQAGSILGENDELEVQIEYPSDEASRATSMRVELRDTQGSVHGAAEFDQTQLAEPFLPAVQFSEPPDGVYVLITQAWINDHLLVSDRRQIFVTSFPPRIESVTIHPTSIRREMQALAVTDLDYSVTTRPYLRWIFDGEVAAEGYLEDGLDRAILEGAGRSAGAYRVNLEVYPWGVDEGTVIDGATTITADSDVVVREELEPGPPDFVQQREGTALRYFSFDGTPQAWTDSPGETVEATIAGDVYLDMLSGALGVRASLQGSVVAPLPVPEDSSSVHLVELRVSSTAITESLAGDPVITFSGAEEGDEQLPVFIEGGMFVMYPPGSSPISMVSAPDHRELVTLRALLRNEDGNIVLEPVIDPVLDAAALTPHISLGSQTEDILLEVRGQADRQIFLDRITVTAVSEGQLQMEFVDGATRQFLASFQDELGGWAIGLPEAWSELPPFPSDYASPRDALRMEAEESPFINVLLPDDGAVRFYGDSDANRGITLRRRDQTLELVSGELPQQSLSRVEISPVSDGLSLHRVALVLAPAEVDMAGAVSIRMDEDERGDFITLYVPDAFQTAPITVVPDGAEADYPVWVGRWVR